MYSNGPLSYLYYIAIFGVFQVSSGRYMFSVVDVDSPLPEASSSIDSDELQTSISSVHALSKLQDMTTDVDLGYDHIIKMVERHPSHQVEKFIAEQPHNGPVHDNNPIVGQLVNIEFAVSDPDECLVKSTYPKEEDPWSDGCHGDAAAHKAALLDFSSLLSASSDLTLCASDEELAVIPEEVEFVIPHIIDKHSDTAADLQHAIDPGGHRRSTEEFGELLAQSMQSSEEESNVVFIKYMTPESTGSSSDSDDVHTSFKPMRKCVVDVDASESAADSDDCLHVEPMLFFTNSPSQTFELLADIEPQSPSTDIEHCPPSSEVGHRPVSPEVEPPHTSPEQILRSSDFSDGSSSKKKKKDKKKRKKEPVCLKQLVNATAATGYELTLIDPDAKKEESDKRTTKENSSKINKKKKEKTKSKKPLVLSELAKSTALTGYELSNIEPGMEGEYPAKDQTDSAAKSSVLSELVHTTAATGLEVTNIEPGSVTEEPNKDGTQLTTLCALAKGAAVTSLEMTNIEPQLDSDIPAVTDVYSPAVVEERSESVDVTEQDISAIEPSASTYALESSRSIHHIPGACSLPTVDEQPDMEDYHSQPLTARHVKKDSALTALARMTAASTYEMSRVRATPSPHEPEEISEDLDLGTTAVKDYENNNNKQEDSSLKPINLDGDDVEESDKYFCSPTIIVEDATESDGEETDIDQEIMDYLDSQISEEVNRSPEHNYSPDFDTRRPSFLTADYETLANMVESDHCIEVSDVDSDCYDDAMQFSLNNLGLTTVMFPWKRPSVSHI